MIEGRSRKLAGIASIFVSLACFAGFGTADASELTGDNVITLINESRSLAGVSALTKNAKLTAAATAKANDMFRQQYFAHVGPDGNGPSYWAGQAGYDWTALGENIAYGYNTAESVHEGFMNSAGHRANILNARYEHVGVAAVGGTYQGRSLIMTVEEFGASNDPAEDVAAQTAPSAAYALTVNGGTGSGSYEEGKTVTIVAAASEAGKVFDKWTGDTQYVSDVNASTATVTMPGKDIALTAVYRSKKVRLYYLNVEKGSGDGWYAAGAKVTIAADASVSGRRFLGWAGRIVGIEDVSASTTTFTMPSHNVSLVARYGSVATKRHMLEASVRASMKNIMAFLGCR
jgi:ribosomal protein L21E